MLRTKHMNLIESSLLLSTSKIPIEISIFTPIYLPHKSFSNRKKYKVRLTVLDA